MTRVLDAGAYLCKNCGNITRIEQDDVYVKAPVICKTCKSVGPWELLLEESIFVELPDEEWKRILQKKLKAVSATKRKENLETIPEVAN